MFIEEARWMQSILAQIELQAGQTVLDAGSSTEEYRRLHQPFIDFYLFRPLRQRGVQIVHLDVQQGDGVDLVCDLASAASDPVVEQIPPADVVLCGSLLEHVPDRDRVIRRLKGLVKRSGVLLLTVPHRYRYHPDPMDTLYRPLPAELERFFPEDDFQVLDSRLISSREKFSHPLSLGLRFLNKVGCLAGSRSRLEVCEDLNNEVAALAVQKR
jgi:SAM-dependent methyltransferase